MAVHHERGTLHADLLGRSRYNELGGDDIDLNLAGLLLERYAERSATELDTIPPGEHRALCSELLYLAEKAKIDLCGQVRWGEQPNLDKSVNYPVRHTPDGKPWLVRVTLRDLFHAVAEFMPRPAQPNMLSDDDRYHYSFNEAIRQALDSAEKVTGSPALPIDLVYLTGGSAQLPMLKDAVLSFKMLRDASPAIPVEMVDHPMEAVALGAARYAGTLAGFRETPIFLRERMFEGIYFRTEDGRFSELISPLTDISGNTAEFMRRYQTDAPGTRIEIDLFAGAGENDPEMQPIVRRSLSFSEPLPPNHYVEFTAAVTANRQVQLGCRTELDGRRIYGSIKVQRKGLDWVREEDAGTSLPPVNTARGNS
jgi:hypothetical protein